MTPADERQLKLQVFTSETVDLGGGYTFPPTTATLVSGASDVVLFDTQFIEHEVRALIDGIRASGKNLTTVVITHGHLDHYLGLGLILEAFPDARAVALPSIAYSIEATWEAAVTEWRQMFGGDLLEATAWPEALDGDVLEIEGQQISLLELAQADVAPTSIGHVPSLDAIIAGDAVYNRVHPMLALTGPEEWEAWIESIDEVEALRPRTVVAGHKRRDARDDDIPAMIDGTRGYIRDFRAALAVSSDPVELFETMKAKYEEYGNPTTLFVSAGAAFNRS